MTPTHQPAWHRDALCYGSSTPQLWDSPTGSRLTVRTVLHGVEVCEGCPVAPQCAAAALDERFTGVIMGGVALPSGVWWANHYSARYRATLRKVARGVPIAHAVASELCKTRGLGPAARELVDRVIAGGHPVESTPLSEYGGSYV